MAKGRWPALRIRWHSKEVFVFFCLAPVLLFLTLTSVLGIAKLITALREDRRSL